MKEFKLVTKDLLLFIAALLLIMGIAFLPTQVALIVSGLLVVVYAWIKPFQSLLFLALYVAVRPILIELNPGLKAIGDILTFVVLARLFWNSRKEAKKWFQFLPFEYAFFAFLAFGAIIGLLNDVSIASVVFQLRTFAIMYILFYILSKATVPESFLYRFAWVAVALGWLVSIHGIIEKLSMRQWLLPDVWKYKTLSATNFVRIYGLPGNPNSLALILLFTLIAVVFLMLLYKNQKYRIFLYASAVVFLGVFILTYSRGTWISAAVLLMIFIALSKEWQLLKKMAISGVLAFVLVYIPVTAGVTLFQSLGLEAPVGGGAGSIGGRVNETFDQENLALMAQSGRIFYLKKGFEVFRDYPITGSGFGTFGGAATLSYDSPIYDEYGIRSDIYGGKNFYSDNQYIQVIAETGVIGVILFAAFLLGMLWIFWKDRHTRFGQFMIALWFATGVSGMYYNIWELKSYAMIYFMLFGIYAASRKLYKPMTLQDRS